MRVFNLFDTRFFNGAVFASTGSPYYSRYPSPAEEVSLAESDALLSAPPDRGRRALGLRGTMNGSRRHRAEEA